MLEIDDLKVGRLIENRYELIQKLGDGGFAVVWEVKDVQANNDRKAIKFLKSQDDLAIKLFRNEFWTLDSLKYDRIIKVQPHSLYPEKEPSEDDYTLQFFVMEKVDGKTLEKLIKESVIEPNSQKLFFAKSIWQFLFCRYPPLRSRITYVQIANWLEQITKALEYIHELKIIHCDIKPANIIITPNGDIKLIDFGAATRTNGEKYVVEFDSRSQIVIGTSGYAAPEQKDKQVLLASDFYSLGKTILSALTAQKPPLKIDESKLRFPPELTAFLVRATKEDHTERYLNAEDLHKKAEKIARSLRRKYSRWNSLRQVVKVLGTVAIAAIAIVGTRSTGALQDLELKAYDRMIQMRPDLGADPRLLIVDMTNDFKDISDQNLVDILSRITRYEPRAIGIALQRDELSTSTSESRAALQKIYQQHNYIFGYCEHADTDKKRLSSTFIPSPSTSLGFGNSPFDDGKLLRRHLLMYKNLPADECAATASFSLVIARHYLESERTVNSSLMKYRIVSPPSAGKQSSVPHLFKNLEKVQFQGLELGQGAYHNPKMKEFKNLFQIMIDYRSRKIAEIVPVKQILTEDFGSVRDRIVLIGRASNRDALQLTPYGTLVEMSGVEITGQLISQLIDVAKGTRPILKPATFTLDLLWIVCASCLGGFIGWRVISPIGQVIVLLTLPTTLIGVCFLIFVTQGLWLGAVPITIVAVVANLSVFLYNRYVSTKLWGIYESFKYRD